MDRRSLVAILLALTTYYLWTLWVQSNAPPPVDPRVAEEQASPDPSHPTDPLVARAPSDPEPPAEGLAPVQTAPGRELSLDYCQVQTTWSTEHGALSHAVLTDYEAPWDVTPAWRWVLGLITGDRSGGWQPYGPHPGPAEPLTQGSLGVTAGTGSLARPPGPVEVLEERESSFVLRGVEGPIEVRKIVSVGEDCLLDVEIEWTNRGSRTHTEDLWVGLHGDLPESTSRYKESVRPYAMADEDVENVSKLSKLDEESFRYEGSVAWLGLADSYFASFLLPARQDSGTLRMSRVRAAEQDQYGVHYVLEQSLDPGESHSERFRLFIGPKDVERLRSIDQSLSEAIQLGWFGFFGKILLAMLHFFHGWVGNWGVSIIFLTLSVKLIFFPLTQMAFRSSQAMAALQPELAEIREKHKDDPEELNRQMLKLWRDNGVNPAGGCLPTLIQFPVWIALYQVLLSSVDLYHTEFLYLRDLSSVDPYMAMPAVVMALMFIQQRLMPTGNMDPTQARIMKLMPLIFGIFFFTFPSGLVVYIFVNMVLTILQQWVIKRTFKPAAAA